MIRSIACIAFFCLAAVSAGLVETHHVIQEPVLAKVGTVVHSSPSAVSHQSFTRFHNKAVVTPVIAPVVKTSVHESPFVSVAEAAPIVHSTYAAAPVVHSAPLLQAAPVAHVAPVVHAAPAAYTIYH